MTGRTHDTAAIASLIGVVIITQPNDVNLATALVAVLANQMGGLAPDIDQPTAPFWRNLPIGGFFGRITGTLLGGHRFISHSIIGLIAFGFLAHWVLSLISPIMPSVEIDYVWAAFMIGIISHLIMDSLTKEGVPWLLPIPHKFGIPPLRRLRITTGGKLETLVILPLLLGLSIWLCAHFYEIISLVVTRQS